MHMDNWGGTTYSIVFRDTLATNLYYTHITPLADPSLFLYSKGETVLFFLLLLLYVDDIIVTGNNASAVNALLHQLGSEFDIKDLGPLKFFLGLQIEYRSTGFFVHQRKYATDLLAKFNMSTCKPCSTPFISLSRLCLDDGTPLADPTPFWSMVGGATIFDVYSPRSFLCREPHLSVYASLHRQSSCCSQKDP